MARKRFPESAPTTKVNYVAGHPARLDMRKCVLVLVSDPSRPSFTFNQERITIGGIDGNDIVLGDETVSRQHCFLSQEADGYLLTDLNSTNGTYIDEVRVRQAYLRPGCRIKVGKSELRFEANDESEEVLPSTRERLGAMIGRTKRMREIFTIIEKIAPTSATVVIEGETGTGKEVVAKCVHALSTRAAKPFIVFDCGAVPDNLIESELFGHEKGSFTGAIMSRRGLFEMAQEGTIFLDELCELDLELQPKLLRVLEQREVRRVGSNKPVRVDVRVIAATNRNLEEEVRRGRFREDLFFRLSVVRIFMPPLRDRIEDLPSLVQHFLANEGFNRKLDGSPRVEQVHPDAMDALLHHDWPGNVRELINVLERACSFAETNQIRLTDLAEHLRKRAPGFSRPASEPECPPEPAPPPPLLDPAAHVVGAGPQPDQESVEPTGILAEVPLHLTFKDAKEEWISVFEKDYLLHLLKKNRMNISHAAREADIDRKYLRKLMRKYGILSSDASPDEED